MTKALKNLHENLVAITFLIKNMSSPNFYKGKGIKCLTWGQQEKRGLSIFYSEVDHRTNLLLMIIFFK